MKKPDKQHLPKYEDDYKSIHKLQRKKNRHNINNTLRKIDPLTEEGDFDDFETEEKFRR